MGNAPKLELSLGEQAAIARIEEALFGRGPGPVRLGRYEIISVVGTGAFGRVYRARDPQLDRQVALKLLSDAGAAGDPAARDRLLGEAKIMATITDPNVATIYDAGVVGQGNDARVFLAMELVSGKSLRDWLAERRRTPREVLAVMRQAGRGLAAAHAAGVVHRDFKPDNVLVGDDGRVRVVDFGLARPLGRADPPAQEAPGGDPSSNTASSGVQYPLRTVSGAILGTPAYMSPEQHDGRGADTLSDQYAYCVTFWEALFGERPFGGKDRAALADSTRRGHPRRPAGRAAPRWIERVIARGLAPAPPARFADLPALLAALDRGAPRWPYTVVALVMVAGVTALGLVALSPAPPPNPCATEGDLLGDTWNASRRQEVGTALARVAPDPTGQAAAVKALDGLDRYAFAWRAGFAAACEATYVQKAQPPELLDRRMACLDDRRRQLAALVEVLRTADPVFAHRAAVSVRSLDPVAGCADIAALQAGVAPIRDEATRRSADVVYDELARVAALYAAGRNDEALARAQMVRPRATAIGYPPLEASAALWVAAALMSAGRQEEAAQTAREAFDKGLAGSDEGLALHAATLLAFLNAFDPSKKAEALGWVRTGRALQEHVHDEGELDAELSNAEGNIYLNVGEPARARGPLERSVASWRRVDPDHPDLGATIGMLGIADLDSGQITAAHGRLTEAVARLERAFGPAHPEVATALVNLALAETSLGLYATAEGTLRRALELQHRAFGDTHPLQIYSNLNLGEVLTVRGRDAEAEGSLREAERVAGATFGPAHPLMGKVQGALAVLLVRMGRLDEARLHANQSIQIIGAALGAQSPSLGRPYATLAMVERAAGRPGEAVAQARVGLVKAVAGFGEKNVEVALVRLELGQALLAAGDPAGARAELETADRLLPEVMPDPRRLSEVRFARARATVADAPSARALAQQALALWPAAGDPRVPEEIRAWIAAR